MLLKDAEEYLTGMIRYEQSRSFTTQSYPNGETPMPPLAVECVTAQQQATEVARSFGHAYLGPEHLLVAIARHPTPGIIALMQYQQIRPERLEGMTLAMMVPFEEPVTLRRLPKTPRFARTISLAERVAQYHYPCEAVELPHLLLSMMIVDWGESLPSRACWEAGLRIKPTDWFLFRRTY